MSPISPQEQAMLNKQYRNSNGKERAQIILTTFLGLKLTDEDIATIESGVVEYFTWHERQHRAHERCEDCEIVQNNLIMIRTINYWVDTFKSLKSMYGKP